MIIRYDPDKPLVFEELPEHTWTNIDLPTDLESQHVVALRDTKIALKIFLDNHKDLSENAEKVTDVVCKQIPEIYVLLGTSVPNVFYYTCQALALIQIILGKTVKIAIKIR